MIWPSLGRRPVLLGSVALGLVGFGLARVLGVQAVTAGLLAWDGAALAYSVAIALVLWSASPEALKERAERLDENRWVILLLSALAALASLVAVGADLALAHGTEREGFAAVLGGGSVLVSWVFLQLLFAHHYAHEHWLRGEGLDFPGNDRPDFPEFLYFALTVGMTAQVSDVTTRSAAMRRLVMAHAVLAFFFNAVVVAAAVNLAAALVG